METCKEPCPVCKKVAWDVSESCKLTYPCQHSAACKNCDNRAVMFGTGLNPYRCSPFFLDFDKALEEVSRHENTETCNEPCPSCGNIAWMISNYCTTAYPSTHDAACLNCGKKVTMYGIGNSPLFLNIEEAEKAGFRRAGRKVD